MTIEHVVLIEWSPEVPEHHRMRASEIAGTFPHRIPGVERVVQGANVSPEGLGDGYNFGMLVSFVDALARDAYLPHPVHQEFVALLEEGASRRVTVFDLVSS